MGGETRLPAAEQVFVGDHEEEAYDDFVNHLPAGQAFLISASREGAAELTEGHAVVGHAGPRVGRGRGGPRETWVGQPAALKLAGGTGQDHPHDHGGLGGDPVMEVAQETPLEGLAHPLDNEGLRKVDEILPVHGGQVERVSELLVCGEAEDIAGKQNPLGSMHQSTG